MESVLNSVIILAIFVGGTSAVGFRLDRFKKPYDRILLASHMILFLFIASGVAASVSKLNLVQHDKMYSMISIQLLVLTVVISLFTGIVMALLEEVNKKLVAVHKYSTILMAIAIGSSILFLILEI